MAFELSQGCSDLIELRHLAGGRWRWRWTFEGLWVPFSNLQGHVAVRPHASITVTTRMHPIVLPAVLDSIPSQCLSAYTRPTLVSKASRVYLIASSRGVGTFQRSNLTIYPA